jgi:ketose-bisphosphate aldolase
MDTLLRAARAEGRALPAFECWDSNSVQAIATAARRTGQAVIFQASATEYGYCGGPDALAAMVRWYMDKYGIDGALHLDHGTTLAHVEECLAAGFTSVMIDASRESFAENVRLTREAVAMANAADASVEAELGHVAGAEAGLEEIAEHEAALTDPEEAARFVEETGCHCLAVAIGTVHGVYRGVPNIRTDRLAAIVERVEVPIVLHGGSGTPPDRVRECIRLGVAKVNICTELQQAWLDGIAATRKDLTISVPGLFYVPPFEALLAVMLDKIALFGG